MLLILAAAIVSTPPQAPVARPVGTRALALATIRIISGAELHLDTDEPAAGLVARDSMIRSGGVEQPAKLIEFQ